MTAQAHERLIFEGEKTSMAFCPPLPEAHPRLIELSLEEARKDADSNVIFSTGCWRGYIGTWEVKDGLFYLVDITGRYKMVGSDPLLADWFTGVLRIPRGEMLHYVHMGFGSVYEEEVHVKIENGKVAQTRVIDNRGKEFDREELGWRNLPGSENRFDGDDEL